MKKKKNESQKPKKWIPDPDGQLGIAKSIAARFGEEIVEDEFYDEPEAQDSQEDRKILTVSATTR
jgi:hypothetical protein